MLQVPAFKQSDDSRCGPASIKMVLAYYGINVPEDELCIRCEHTYELGCDDYGMKRAIESYGLSCEIFNDQTIEDLKYWVDRGIPTIVDWFTPGVDPKPGDMPNGHSSVVVDVTPTHVKLLDPENGKYRDILHTDFLRVWLDWRGRNNPYLQYRTLQDDMVIRQIMVPYPPSLSAVGRLQKPQTSQKTPTNTQYSL